MRVEHDTPVVPWRQVDHQEACDEFTGYDLPRGETTTLPMDAVARQQARARRRRLDELGGFGFGAAA